MTKRNPRSAPMIVTAALVAFASVPAAFAAAPTLKAIDSARAHPAAAVAPQLTRLIVQFKQPTDSTVVLRTVESAAGRATLQGAATNGRSAALRATYVRKLGIGADVLKVSRTLSTAESTQLLAQLRSDPNVAYAQLDTLKQIVRAPESVRGATNVSPSLVPNDPYFAQYQWHLQDSAGGIKAPAAWETSTGTGTVVAVLDTGVTQHPDLVPNLLPGYDFITDAFVSRRATDDRVPGAADLGDWNPVAGECYAGSPVSESSWHGTHVSGTIAEVTNNGVGMAGVAHNAKVLPVRVLGRCGGYTSDIADAIIWASGGTVAGVPANANPAEVINMSLGGGGACDAATQAAINGAVSRGTTVVVAAGNDASNAANFSPASCDNTISVGANRVTGGIASYSNFGAKVDLAGPGGGGSVDGNPGGYVWQNWYDGATTPTSGAYTYIGYTGTSMASPHVAAVVALLQSVVPTPLTPAAIEELLKDTARPFPVSIPASTPIGAGIVDAAAALAKALEPPCTENCAPDAEVLVNKVPVTGISGAQGSETLYALEVPAGAVGPLSVLTYGGTGNVSLLVSFGAEPTAADADASSSRPGNSETVRIAAPQAGTYFIKLVGTGAFTNVSLQARHN